jgi:2-oxoglutarate ferredoxin oxidoreductase subunit beta
MSIAAPTKKRAPKVNKIGLSLDDYKGAVSTLCKGCGHDAISSSIMKAFFELGIEPHRIAKLSGIGCSSKTPAYFFNQAHGFNSVHGRMATIASGAAIANRSLINIGVSGDGDTASIGLGNFCHMVRRNVPIVYIVENNGCYGLTKGQASATADRDSKLKSGFFVAHESIDLCAIAVEMGCGYVARSFSGDTAQVRALIKGAIAFGGTAVLDILSPCVTFNDHEGSTRSRNYVREHKDPLHEIDFIPSYDNISVEYDPGTTKVVELHDGSKVTLKKLTEEYDPSQRSEAFRVLDKTRTEGHIYTGLVYYNDEAPTVHDHLGLMETPLSALDDTHLRPGPEAFESIMASFR